MINKTAISFFILLLISATLFAQKDSSLEIDETKRAIIQQQQAVTDEYLSSVDNATAARLIVEVSILAQGERGDSIANYIYRRSGDKKGYCEMLIALSNNLISYGNDYSKALYYYQKGLTLLEEETQADSEILEQCIEFWEYYNFYLNRDDREFLRKSWDASVHSNSLLVKLYAHNMPQADEYAKLKLLNTYRKLYQKTLELYGKMSEAGLLTSKDLIHWAEYSMFWENMRTPNSPSPLTFKEIQQHLKRGEIAVHLAYQETNRVELDAMAIVIPHKGDVYSIPLDLMRNAFFPTSQRDIFPVSQDKREARINDAHNSGSLYYDFWKPFYDRYSKAHTIYYSTIGEIGFLSHSAFSKRNDTEICLSDEKEMRLLSSLNELGDKQPASSLKDIAIFGDINYYKQVVEESMDNRDALRRTVASRADKLMRLPYSQYEVNQLKMMMAKHKIKSNYHTNRQATEKAFRALSGNSPQVIHFSTHGFYISNVPYISSGVSFFEQDETAELQRRIDEQNRACGLFLAGAGQHWNDEAYKIDDADDGVLTAGEVASMDLSGTELVVLSACNTGIGHFEQTQNIVGLWRAFKQAGVKSILMTLWEVDDEVAAQMMLSFYQYWIETGDKYKAFSKAQKAIRKRFPEPYHWGAFVLMD